MDNQECKYLYAIIRKPQEGKTFICINNIKQNPETIHIIFTMNTIKSNKQFFERADQVFGEKLIILNSEKKSDSSHSNSVLDIIDCFSDNKKDILIMCCNKTRFTKSIQKIIKFFKKVALNKSIIIHIDEAHAYVPNYRKELNELNNENIVDRIYLYSATPFNCWFTNKDEFYELYKKIYVVDICEQFRIRESNKYFGVKDVELYLIKNNDNSQELDSKIPRFIIDKWCPKLLEKKMGELWYNNSRTYFDLGKEYEFLCFLKYALLKCIKKKYIQNDKFSYNFFPAYTRIVTHFGVMDIILKTLNNAIVIVFNGLVANAYINFKQGIKELVLENENEPSIQIEKIINKYPNRPVFITGHICVGMSVTLINSNIGNFDNVLFSFPQYFKQHDVLYQMCRFLFNYISWSPEKQAEIKKTKFLTDNIENYKICLNYEKQIDEINKKMIGSLRTLDEVIGNVKIKKYTVPLDKKINKISIYKNYNIKKFKVYDENDTEIWEKVEKFWLDFKGKNIPEKSKPKLNDFGFRTCSITGKPKVFELNELKYNLDKLKWYSNYQLCKGIYNYARLYIGYDSLENNSEYTIFIRWLTLENNKDVDKFLESISKN